MVRRLSLISVRVLAVTAVLGAASGHAEHRVAQPSPVAALAAHGPNAGAGTGIVGGSALSADCSGKSSLRSVPRIFAGSASCGCTAA